MRLFKSLATPWDRLTPVSKQAGVGYDGPMIQWVTDEEFIRAKSDADLLAAYQATTGESDDAEAMALLAEIERRGLDV